jgi:hypothetical protein
VTSKVEVKVSQPSFIKPKEPVIATGTPVISIKEPEPKKQSFEYENKVIEDILRPSGVAVKPTDNQLNDFVKRVKTLNKDVVSRIIIDKIRSFENASNDQNLFKQFTRALYVVEWILVKKVEGYKDIFSEQISLFYPIETTFASDKKVTQIVNSILIQLGDRKPIQQVSSSNVSVGTFSNNVNLIDDIMSNNTTNDDSAFSGLELRNKPNSNSSGNSNNSTTNKQNGFGFIKSKGTDTNVNAEQQTNNTNQGGFSFVKNKNKEEINVNNNKELFNIFTNDNNTNTKPQPQDSAKKQGFSFIKNGKNNNEEKDDLDNVFQSLNVVGGKTEEKITQNSSQTLSKTLQETLNNKLDLDKLYQENNTNIHTHMNNHNIMTSNMHFNNMNQVNNMIPNYHQQQQFSPQQYTPQQFFNNNFGIQNISYHQNYDLGVSLNTSSNIRTESYTPLDMKDYNQQPKQIHEEAKKDMKDHHFDFVNDLMKKKK